MSNEPTWQTPTTWNQRFTEALTLLCGKRPPDAAVKDWLTPGSDGLQLQSWMIDNVKLVWAQGIVALDAAALLADTPAEAETPDSGVVHAEREKPVVFNALPTDVTALGGSAGTIERTPMETIRPSRCDDPHALATLEWVLNHPGHWVIVCRSDATVRMLRNIMNGFIAYADMSIPGSLDEFNNGTARLLLATTVHMRSPLPWKIETTPTSLAVCYPLNPSTLNRFAERFTDLKTAFVSTQGNG